MRSSADLYESYSEYEKAYGEQKMKYSKYLDEMEQQKFIDEQTIMFWDLQLQFIDKSSSELDSLMWAMSEVGKKVPLCYLNKTYIEYTEKDRSELATHLALQLSGLA